MFFNRDIGIGSNNEEVLELKKLLVKNGYTNINNVKSKLFDRSTARELFRFQKDNFINERDKNKINITKGDDVYFLGGSVYKTYTYIENNIEYNPVVIKGIKKISTGFFKYSGYFKINDNNYDKKYSEIISDKGNIYIVETILLEKVNPVYGILSRQTLKGKTLKDPTFTLTNLDETSIGAFSTVATKSDRKTNDQDTSTTTTDEDSPKTVRSNEVNNMDPDNSEDVDDEENSGSSSKKKKNNIGKFLDGVSYSANDQHVLAQYATNKGMAYLKYVNPVYWMSTGYGGKTFDLIERNVQAVTSVGGAALSTINDISNIMNKEYFIDKTKEYIKIYNLTGIEQSTFNRLNTDLRSNARYSDELMGEADYSNNIILLPVRAESIQDDISAVFQSETPRGRTASYWGYEKTNDRNISFSVKLYRQDMDDLGFSANNIFLRTINKCKSLCYPDYKGDYGTIAQPYCYVYINEYIKFMAICSSVNIGWEGDVQEDRNSHNIYTVANISFSFTAVTKIPFSSSDVISNGNVQEMEKYY